MPPITVSVPAVQSDAIAAEVQRTPAFDGDADPLVRIWIGPALEIVLTIDAADRLADALVDALAIDDDGRPLIAVAGSGIG